MQRGVRHTNTDDHKRAQELRRTASPYERVLWKALSQSATAAKLRFRRQQPIPPYIADFACMRAKLLVELDGASHDARAVYDQQRDAYLKKQGYTVLRFSNDDLKRNLKGVVETIIIQARALLVAVPPTCEN